jgi:hypothetical protein
VKVGRSAFDEEAIRAIEAANPDIAFDWGKILEARPPEPEPDTWRSRRSGRGGRDREREAIGRSAPRGPARVARVPGKTQADTVQEGGAGRAPDEEEEEGERLPALASEPSAAELALGAEGLSRVRARYAEVLARISAQVTDDAIADELRGLAERLNPDAWVTADEVRLGLEDFERVLEQVRQRLGPAPRPRREAPPGEPPAGPELSDTPDSAPPDGAVPPAVVPED